jgi:hypothetical protein
MAVGANISYKLGPGIRIELAKKLGSGRTAGKSPTGNTLPKLCVKVSATAPQDNTADDFPNALGDICLHFDAAGAIQGIYIAKSGNLSSTCDWVQLI